MGCCRGCTAVKIGLEEKSRPGMKVPSPDIARFRLDWEPKGVGWGLVVDDASAAVVAMAADDPNSRPCTAKQL